MHSVHSSCVEFGFLGGVENQWNEWACLASDHFSTLLFDYVGFWQFMAVSFHGVTEDNINMIILWNIVKPLIGNAHQ